LTIQRVSAVAGQPSDDRFRHWAEATLQGRPEPVELTLRLVDEAESRRLNRKYRDRDRPTNVLSFPFEVPPEIASPLLGDLVICAPLVAAEAEAQGKPLEAHWAHMVAHGLLHLLGYEHQTDLQAREMEAEERRILARLGWPDPYRNSDSEIGP